MAERPSKASRAEQAMRDSEARHRAIFESALDGIITIDEHGIIESVNPATERLFGYRADELVGRNVEMLMPAPYFAEHRQYLITYITTGNKNIIGTARELMGRRKDGCEFPVELAVSELFLGGRRMFTGLVHDITDRKAAEKERERLYASERAARAEAERASKAKDDFLAALSHELRTPLTPALLTISLLERNKNLSPEMKADVEVIRRNVEMEARLIDDLLDLTRVMHRKLVMHFQTVDVHQTIWQSDRTCRVEDGIEVTFELSASEHHVRADPARLQQVFWNLLSNAHKFTPIGGRIVVHTFNPSPDKLAIEVSDTGRGIEPELLPRIFNAFEQGDAQTARSFGGLGLGLTITKAIVDAHGGVLRAESEGKGRGATFYVELSTIPVGVPAGDQAGMSSPTEPPIPQPVKPLRILLVEDHEPTMRIVSRLLRDLGHEVQTANSVRRARHMLDHDGFDLLISDLGLPDGSGYEVMEYAAEHYRLKGIALSGYGMSEDVERSKEAGFINHLIKPVDLQTLMNAVSEACTV
jgi:PAS domain S-box-containing protein